MTTTAQSATQEQTSTDVRCPGCGKSFKGERGLRSHQTARFVAMGCKPVAK